MVGVLGCCLLLLVTLPPARALSVRPMYFTQCYGTQEGTVISSASGTYSGGSWSNNYANGSLTLANQTASSPATSSNYGTAGWISMGPGPTNGTCFSPTRSSSVLNYTFSNLSFTLSLSVNCGLADRGTASAQYLLLLQGNIYDLSSASFVWATSPSTTAGSKTIICTHGTPRGVSKTIVHPRPLLVSGSTSNLHPTDKYWFIVDVQVILTTSATGTGASATASVSQLSATLSHIRCPAC